MNKKNSTFLWQESNARRLSIFVTFTDLETLIDIYI